MKRWVKKRWVRRSLAISAGLVLGWMAAGLLPTASGGSEDAAANGDRSPAASQPAGAESGVRPTAEEGLEGHGAAGAEDLRPEPGTTPWLKPVLAGIAGLFVAALAVGLAVRAAGVRDPSIVATEADNAAHDDAGGHGSAPDHAEH